MNLMIPSIKIVDLSHLRHEEKSDAEQIPCPFKSQSLLGEQEIKTSSAALPILTSIIEAAKQREISQSQAALLQAALQNRDNLNRRDLSGRTALMYAARYGYDDIVGTLLNKPGIELELKSSRCQNTALMYAIIGNGCESANTDKQLAIILLFLRAKACLAHKNTSGQTPLDLVKKYFCPKTNRSDLFLFFELLSAIEAQDPRKVEFLLALGIDLRLKDQQGASALWHAARRNHMGIFRAILPYSQSCKDEPDKKGRSPLHIALDTKDETMALELIPVCANLETPDPKHGLVPLHIAIDKGMKGVVIKLLAAGVNPNSLSCGKRGITALIEAVLDDDVESLVALLQHGADPNLECKTKRSTPLLMCLFRMGEELSDPQYKTQGVIANELIKAGAIFESVRIGDKIALLGKNISVMIASLQKRLGIMEGLTNETNTSMREVQDKTRAEYIKRCVKVFPKVSAGSTEHKN